MENKKNLKTKEIDIDILKNDILDSRVINYNKDKFHKIEASIREVLKKQSADEAMLIITTTAIDNKVSDIHFENYENKTSLRFRIDGVLINIFDLDKKEYKLLLERIKYASGLKMNISEVPQDGKYSLKINNRKIDTRVSTLPTKYGENIVSRILDSSKNIIDFEDLGFFWNSKRIIEKTIKKKNGLILVTGPTGSGKTTTLYTMLNKLNTEDKKIITLEDPIEYEVEGIVQSEVDEKKGYNFEAGLKALMRQDPDIIMLGEIRDLDTLKIATEASLTGHLVLSTLHTKSAAETIDRMLSMGLKPYILASAIDTIIAQRLVRRVCEHCKQEVEKTPEEKQMIDLMLKETGASTLALDNIKLYRGCGCEHCNNTGYSGRIGIYEIITFNDKIREMIRDGSYSQEIVAEAKKMDMITLVHDGILKAMKGHTTIEELLRII